jgi:hypothetical protein
MQKIIRKTEKKSLVHFYQEEKYLKRVDAFWKAFQENAALIIPAFHRKNDFKPHQFLDRILRKVHPDLDYYFIPRSMRSMDLVISISSRVDLYPLVDLMWKKCRTIGRSWGFCFQRPRYDYELIKLLVEVRSKGNLDEYMFSGSLDHLNRINILFIHKDATTVENKCKAIDVLSEGISFLIGERTQRVWVGSLDIISQIPGDEKVYPIRALPQFIDEKVEEARKRLPKEPYGIIDGMGEWVGIDFDPPEECDYTGRSDMVTMCTMLPQVIESYHNDYSFYSERFSNFNETFCYLKMERWRQNDEMENEEYKIKLIDELNMGLRKNKMGMVIGAGTGLKYAYIDFVISNIPRGGRIIQSKLRKFKITKNAWIMFFDSSMEANWINVYDDTPPPVLPDFESRGIFGIEKKLNKLLEKKITRKK